MSVRSKIRIQDKTYVIPLKEQDTRTETIIIKRLLGTTEMRKWQHSTDGIRNIREIQNVIRWARIRRRARRDHVNGMDDNQFTKIAKK